MNSEINKSSQQALYQLGDVSPANIQQLKALNIATLPVRYSDKFYRDLISNYTTEYLKYAIWNGFVVAAVCARLETSDLSDKKKLYIMTVNVLAPYRRRGIGKFVCKLLQLSYNVSTASKLLKYITDKAEKDSSIDEIYLHVQISNADAKTFYLSHGFIEVEIIHDYYKNIEPSDCFLLRKQFDRKLEHSLL